MKIRRVKDDADDMTLAIPSAILPGLNADFDGDELNSITMVMPELAELVRDFSPCSMIINRTDCTIKMDISALENVSVAMFSDH